MLFLKVIERLWFCFFGVFLLEVTVSASVDLHLLFGLAYLALIFSLFFGGFTCLG